MRPLSLPRLVHELPAELWPAGRRARDLTLLFVERYRGPRKTRKLTAHTFWELTTVMSGTETILGRTALEMHQPAACLIPPGYRHDEFAEHDVDTIWVGFQGRQVVPPRWRTGITVVESQPLLDLVGQLWLFAATTHGRIGPELDAQLANILHRFLRLAAEDRIPAADAMQHAVEYLMRHHADVLHMSEIARRHGFSTGYFCRQFRKRTGLAPNAYLTRIRLQAASQLLRQSTLPVKEIAGRVGMPDEAYFSRLFKRFAGVSPMRYRDHPI
ncbi:MAG: helix-turn-helix transcriptional regulator [Kiritimatiellia bacterium]